MRSRPLLRIRSGPVRTQSCADAACPGYSLLIIDGIAALRRVLLKVQHAGQGRHCSWFILHVVQEQGERCSIHPGKNGLPESRTIGWASCLDGGGQVKRMPALHDIHIENFGPVEHREIYGLSGYLPHALQDWPADAW
jgi:hypothetical protein